MKYSLLTAVAAMGTPAVAEYISTIEAMAGEGDRGNSWPGKIVRWHDPDMNGHLATIDRDLVEDNVLQCVRYLTNKLDTDKAFESLFPGVHSGSTFAIKVNCIGSCCSRWEVTRGVVSGLSKMFDNTYDVSRVDIYDQHNLAYYGYDAAEFTFNGNSPTINHSNHASGSGYEAYPGHQLSGFILDCDYLINLPVLKSHSHADHQITGCLKNHYGSLYPSNLCGNIPGMLTVNVDVNVKDKTSLIVTDALRATYDGDPLGPPMIWSLYPEQTPNTLLVSTDPVTNDYWCRDLINSQRTASGLATLPCPWIEQASGSPYNLGVSNPTQMAVINSDLSALEDETSVFAGGTFLSPNAPNPFNDQTVIHFRLAEQATADLRIIDLRGRVVRKLSNRSFPAGYSSQNWDSRDSRGRKVPAGVYFARLQVGKVVSSRRLMVTR